MYQLNRQQEILKTLEAKHSCSISDLASTFNVSEETIRRDIRQLEGTGRVQKVHGGVCLPDTVIEDAYHHRISENARQKQQIAARAAEMVHNGMTLLLDSGSTTYWLARALTRFSDLTIITNAFEIVRELSGQNNNQIYFAGGKTNPDYNACFGQDTLLFMQRFTPELAFFSISAIDVKAGFQDIFLEESELKHAMAKLARKVVVLADTSKFSRTALVRTFAFSEVDVLISDGRPPKEYQTVLQETDVLQADSPEA